MSNEYQEPMADGNDHPLKHVPQSALHSARDVLRTAAEDGEVKEGLVEPIADAIVLQLVEDGHDLSRLDVSWHAKHKALEQLAAHLNYEVTSLHGDVDRLQEELARRYRDLESARGRAAELERELDYQFEEARGLRLECERLRNEATQ